MINKRKIIIIGSVIAVLIILSVQLYRIDYKYKKVVGAYDIMSLLNLEIELNHLIDFIENDKSDTKKMNEIEDNLQIVNNYIFKSPNLSFLNIYVQDIIDYEVEEIDDKKLNYLKKLHTHLVKVKHEIVDENRAIETYKYFENTKNRKKFEDILEFVR